MTINTSWSCAQNIY